MRAAAIVPAAGAGARLGFRTPKAFLALDGEAILERTIAALARAPGIALILPVVPRTRLAAFERLRGRRRWRGCLPAIAGGRERQDSVAAGLAALPRSVGYVVVHDAARPFVTPGLVGRVLDAARRHGAALAAVPVPDTVKRVSAEGLLEGTVDRRGLWLAQTPQAFRADLLREAHGRAGLARRSATDDAALVEALGHPVHVVAGSTLNFKVTSREDLALARALARRPPAGRAR